MPVVVAMMLLAIAVAIGCSRSSVSEPEGAGPETPPPVAVHGVVRNRLFEPIAGATVQAVEGNWQGGPTDTTGPDGRFSITLQQTESTVLSVRAPGYQSTVTRVETVEMDATTVVSLRAAPSVAVEVRQAGAPRFGTLVRLLSPRLGFVDGRHTDWAGRAGILDVPAGSYVIEAGEGEFRTRREISVEGDSVTAVALDLPEPSPAGFKIVHQAEYSSPVRCQGSGWVLEWRVAFVNGTGMALPELVIADTLDGAFGASLRAEDVVLNRERFPNANIELAPDGRSFVLRLGTLEAHADTVAAYVVTLPASSPRGMWCNTVTASDSRDTACHASFVDVPATLDAWDGGNKSSFGDFDTSSDSFPVGSDLSYRLAISNHECEPLAGLRITATLQGDAVMFVAPPTTFVFGSGVVTSWDTRRIVWDHPTYPGNSTGAIEVRARATRPGTAVLRLEAHTTNLPIPFVAAETTTVVPR